MPRVNMNWSVSIVDAVSILFGLGGIIYAVFGIQSGLEKEDGLLGSRIQVNEREIAHVRSDISRVERQAGEADRRVLEQLNKLERGMSDIRAESASGRKDILDKLDKLIERELDIRNGGPRQP